MSSQVMGQNLSWQLALASGGAGLLMTAQQIGDGSQCTQSQFDTWGFLPQAQER
jgi:hypothetical protein